MGCHRCVCDIFGVMSDILLGAWGHAVGIFCCCSLCLQAGFPITPYHGVCVCVFFSQGWCFELYVLGRICRNVHLDIAF